MKLTLTLVLVSLSVLAASKQDFVRKRRDPDHHECGNSTAPPGNITNPGTPIQSPTSTPSNTSTTDTLTPASTPIPQVRVATTTATTGGWVQNPKGNASFTAYSGCQSACKSCAHVFSVFGPTLSVTSSYSVRPVSERVLRRGQRARIRRKQWCRWSLRPLL
jgi:hypothetical protein